jgi:ankyrin repeat protein
MYPSNFVDQFLRCKNVPKQNITNQPFECSNTTKDVMHLAVLRGDIDCVRKLLNGAEVRTNNVLPYGTVTNRMNIFGLFPLTLAAYKGDLEVIFGFNLLGKVLIEG